VVVVITERLPVGDVENPKSAEDFQNGRKSEDDRETIAISEEEVLAKYSSVDVGA
jgi:hypothetical protein